MWSCCPSPSANPPWPTRWGAFSPPTIEERGTQGSLPTADLAKDLRDILVAVVHREPERRHLVSSVLVVDVRALRDEEAHDLGPSASGGHHDRREALAAARVDVGPGLDQRGRRRARASRARLVQQRGQASATCIAEDRGCFVSQGCMVREVVIPVRSGSKAEPRLFSLFHVVEEGTVVLPHEMYWFRSGGDHVTVSPDVFHER